MKENDITVYINENFPNLKSGINIRFELGGQYANGTDERINQAISRAVTIFESIFRQDDSVDLYICANADDNPTNQSRPADYLFSLLTDFQIEQWAADAEIEGFNTTGEAESSKTRFQISTLSGKASEFPYEKILAAIGKHEQGLTPSIYESVYFINRKRDIIFHMYDDRGCIVYAKSMDALRGLSSGFQDWLTD